MDKKVKTSFFSKYKIVKKNKPLQGVLLKVKQSLHHTTLSLIKKDDI